MLNSFLFDQDNPYILVKGTISISPVPPPAANPNNNDKEVVFKNCVPYNNSISEIKNTNIDHAKYIEIVIPTYSLIESSYNYSRTLESSWQYYRDKPSLDDGNVFAYFSSANNNSAL